MAAAVGRKKGRKRAVLVKAVQQCDDDGKTATVQNVRAEHSVLTAENKKRNQDPKSRVTLRKAIHKKPPVLDRRDMYQVKAPAVLYFLLHSILFFTKRCFLFPFDAVILLQKQKKCVIITICEQISVADTTNGWSDRRNGGMCVNTIFLRILTM